MEKKIHAESSSSNATPSAVVGIGASAGGIEALKTFFQAMPADTGMAFVVVQHLAASHVSMLAEILGRTTKMSVCEVQDEPRVEANHVYVIPPGRLMSIHGGKLHLIPRSASEHHSIDLFFNALAEDQRHRAIGVVLSGSATDGTAGLASIKTAGGITFAQDESAQHEGMPRNAINAGVVDLVLPPAHIAQEIVRLKEHPYVAEGDKEPIDPREDVDPVLAILRKNVGVDFSQYKSNTLHRRIRRRTALHKLAGLDEYAAFLRESAVEVEALYQDILISVTNFFRNPEAFEVLRKRVFPQLFKDRGRGDPLRVWVLGCSTGEEPYSLAMALCEYVTETHSNVPVVIYATDLNNVAVEKARAGLYPKSIEEHVSPERLRHFFVQADGGYRVTKTIRDLCVFARHNALTDPPFSRMDLISCRNVMIYLEAALQRRLMPVLHYALKPGGFLFLGPSETTGAGRELFEIEDMRNKIFSKRAGAAALDRAVPLAAGKPRPREKSARWVDVQLDIPRTAPRESPSDVQREADRVLLTRYVPAGVLVNAEHEVLQFRGDTGFYLAPAPGEASLNLFKMAREGLLVSLRALLQRVRKQDEIVREEGVRVRSNGGYREVTVTVIPVGNAKSRERCYWVLFEPTQAPPEIPVPQAKGPRARAAQDKLIDERDQVVARLTQELAATREYLQSVIEQQEAANQELQSANEEVQSANEELQSINEELETSKEEIQSSNEELTTVNEELSNRNEELNRANNDLNNLFSSVQMAIVMVWPDLRVRRFTPMAEKLFNLIAADVGRPIGDIKFNIDLPDLPRILTETIDTVATRELEVRDEQGHWYLLRVRPYRTIDNKIDGAVVLLVDIDSLKQSQEKLASKVVELDAADRHRNEFLAMLAHELRNPLAPVRNAVQIMRTANAPPEAVQRARDLIGRQVNTLSRLVDDLLDAARINRGQVQLRMEPVELQTIVARAIETVQPSLESRGHRVSVLMPPEPVVLEADPMRLEQVFSNLLTNAAKYTLEAGDIVVAAERLAGSQVRVRVRDNGIGIAEEVLDRVFDLFAQADQSLARTQGGLGIGLSVVRSLVELHGGRVEAASEGLGRGSTFSVYLPTPPVERHRTQKARSAASGGESQQSGSQTQGDGGLERVLVVDDSYDIAESTSMLLSLSGYEVATAHSGYEALEKATQFHPRAVLLDIGMPDLTGYEVCRQLRDDPEFKTTLMVAVTGYGSAQDRERAREAGFDHYLMKPFDPGALENLLRRPPRNS